MSLAATRKGGRAVIVGNAPPVLEVDGLALQRGDRSLIGVLMYGLEDFHTAMRSDRRRSPRQHSTADELIARYPLDRIDDAFRDVGRGIPRRP